MKNFKFYIILLLTIFMIQACGGSKTTLISEQKTISITTLSVTKTWQSDPVQRDWIGAKTYCQGLELGGEMNWRLPSSRDFFELLDNNKSIDSHFPGNDDSTTESAIKEFWSITETSFDTTKAWKISAWSNSEAYADKIKTFGVRCVSGEASSSHTFTQEDGDLIDTDENGTKLLWQDDTNTTKLLTFQVAKEYCNDKDMRLPTIFELLNTINKENLNSTNFNYIGKDFSAYWSDTPLPTSTDSFLTLNFATGGVSSNDKNSTNYVRCVKTIDTEKPTIQLNGESLQRVNQGEDYIEENVYVSDNMDDSPTISIVGSVDTTTIGFYEIIYTVTDAAGNHAAITRTVQVIDATKPTITLIGNNLQIIEVGTAYTELNATAYDYVDGNISENIDINSSAVDINSIGEYTVTYNVSDLEGNNAVTKERTIRVEEALNFTSHTVITTATNSSWLDMADLDNDGDLDILSTSEGGVAWYENHGNGTSFTENIINSNNPGTLSSIRTADITNPDTTTGSDGYLDIVYTVPNETQSIVYCANDTNKNFDCTTLTLTNPLENSNALVLVDINSAEGTGSPDIIATSGDGVDYYRRVTGGINTSLPIGSNLSNAISVDYGQLSDDTHFDIVVASNNDNRISWYKNNRNADLTLFTETNITEPVEGIYSVNVADVNGDGNNDIISASKDTDTIYWHQNEGGENPSFTARHIITSSLNNLYYASGVDMDSDGDIDILSNSSEPNGKIVWYENIGENANFPEHTVANNVDNVIRVFAADIDNDGNMDVVAGQANGHITFYENTSTTNEKTLPKTGQTVSRSDGDDGTHQAGLLSSFERNNTSEIVTDTSTGLMWQDDNNVVGSLKKWDEANNMCKGLGLGGYNDWRLPEIQALYFLAKKDTNTTLNNTFLNKIDSGYWTSDVTTPNATYVDFSDATETYTNINFFVKPKKYVRCVRGQFLTFNLTRDNNTNMVIDKNHKLMWHDNTEASTTAGTWQDALNYCDTPIGGLSGWRLPNIHELYSIIDPAKIYPALHDIFHYTSEEKYWSSTARYDTSPLQLYVMQFDIGHDEDEEETNNLNIRCVRDIP